MADRDDRLIDTISDYKQVFLRSDAGVRILRDLAEFCGETKNPYVEGSFDRTAQKCGKMSVIMYIRKILSAPDEPRQTEIIKEKTV